MKYLLIIIAAIMIFFNGCDRNNGFDDFKIGTNLWPGYEPLYLAAIDDMYRTNVKVKEYASATVVLNKFRKGEVQAAALTVDEVILLKDQGYSPVIVAVLDISDGADVLISNKSINSLSQLKGKTIGVENSALGAYMLARILEKAELDKNDVHTLSIGINKHEEAFKAGVVDAVVTFEPVRSKLLNFGANEIFSSRDIPGEVVDVLVVNKKYLKSVHVKDILSGWSKATQKVNSRDSKSIDIISNRLKQTNSEFIASLDGLKIPTLDESKKILEDGTMKQTVDKIKKVMLEKGLIKASFDSNDILP